MLVLTRSRNEEIRIGDEVVVRVLDVKGDRVRIGIQAPSSVSVHREEVYVEIVRANQESLNVVGDSLRSAKILAASQSKSGNSTQENSKDLNPVSKSNRRISTEVIHGT